jgi:aspartate aminotransferase-like enzyme
MEPFLTGGEMISSVSLERTTWNEIPWKFEAGTPAIAECIGLGAAVDYLQSIGMEAIEAHEQMLTRYGHEVLRSISGVTLFGPPPEPRRHPHVQRRRPAPARRRAGARRRRDLRPGWPSLRPARRRPLRRVRDNPGERVPVQHH